MSMMKQTMIGASAALAMALGTSVQGQVVEVGTDVGNGADAGLYNDGGIIGQHFANTLRSDFFSMDIRMNHDGVFNQRFRGGIMRWDLSGVTEDFNSLASAGLRFNSVLQSRNILIYGLNDGDAGEAWDEATTTWNTAPGMTPNPGLADIFTTAGQVDTGRWSLLGDWTPAGLNSNVVDGMVGTEWATTYTAAENPGGWADADAAFAGEYGLTTVDPNLSGNLASFLQADTDGLVSLLYMIDDSANTDPLVAYGSGNVAFLTKEHDGDTPDELNFDILGAPRLVMEFGGVALQGDLNGDGFVGIDDLNIVLGAWNQNVPPANPLADPSGDGFVGIDDLNEVLGNWNAGTPPTAGAAVPEPASLALLTIFGAATLGRRRN